MRPLEPTTSKQRVTYGLAFFVLFVALWSWATFGGHVSKTFLANPLTMVKEGYELLAKQGVEVRYRGSLFTKSTAEAELIRMEAEWEAGRLLMLKAAWMADNGIPNSMEASMSKAKAARVANHVTLRCVELCGSLG